MQPEDYIEAVQQRIRAPLTSQEIAMVMYLGGAGFTVAECTRQCKLSQMSEFRLLTFQELTDLY